MVNRKINEYKINIKSVVSNRKLYKIKIRVELI